MLFCIAGKIIMFPLICSYIIHEDTEWLFLELSHYLKWKIAFGKNFFSIFLRPTIMVNSYGTHLCQENRIQGCSAFVLCAADVQNDHYEDLQQDHLCKHCFLRVSLSNDFLSIFSLSTSKLVFYLSVLSIWLSPSLSILH